MKKTGTSRPVCSPHGDIRRARIPQPPDSRSDILRGSYRLSPQSPASSQTAPLNRRSSIIPENPAAVNSFSPFFEIFSPPGRRGCRRGPAPCFRGPGRGVSPLPEGLLGAVEAGVLPVQGHELLVGALLLDAAVVDDDDEAGGADGGQPVGDDQGGAAPGQLVKGGLDALLGDGVQGGGGLVQDEDGRIFQENAGDGHPLL